MNKIQGNGFKEKIGSFLKSIKNNPHIRIIKGVIFSFLLVGTLFIIYFPDYAKFKKLRRVNQELIEENRRLKNEILSVKDKLRRVKTDPYLYEKFVREYLGVAKEGEIVVDIND